MTRSKVEPNDLFFFDNKGELPSDSLVQAIGDLIISSSEGSDEDADSICSLNDSYSSEDDTSSYNSEKEESDDSE